jgi:hypothetical protein
MSDIIQALMADPAYDPAAIVPIKELLKDYPALTENRLRYIASCRAENGAQNSGALLKVGNSMCANKVRFRIWFADHNREKGELATQPKAV